MDVRLFTKEEGIIPKSELVFAQTRRTHKRKQVFSTGNKNNNEILVLIFESKAKVETSFVQTLLITM